MKKVKVTQEQGRAFEAIANGYEKDSIMDGVGVVWHEELEPLNDLRPNEEVLFAKNGRYIWELSSGDILKDRETGKIHEVISESYIGTLLTCHTSPLNLDEIKRR